MEVHLVRHTRPAIEKGVCYGQSDIGLAASFVTEAEQIKKALNFPYGTLYSSPLQRCLRLAERLSTDDDVQTDERLKEVSFGAWELQPWKDIPKETLTPWMENFIDVAPPGGESLNDLSQRVSGFIERLLRRHSSEERILVVTHGGVIRCFWAQILGIPLQNIFRFNPRYGAISRFRLSDKPDFCQVLL